MKIFKYLSVIMLLALVVFFSLGLFIKEVSYANTVTVNADPVKVFAAFNDTAAMSEWLPGFVSFSPEKGQGREMGSVWQLKLEQDGNVYEMTETFKTFVPGNEVSYLLQNDVLENDVTVTFKRSVSGTDVVSSNRVRGNNIMWQSVFVLVKGGFIKHGDITLQNFKSYVENRN